MRTGLFRKEVIDEQSNAVDGRFLMTPKPVYSAIAGLLVVWILAVIIYLNTGSYARKASVSGWLEPSHGVLSSMRMQGAAKCLMYWSVKVN